MTPADAHTLIGKTVNGQFINDVRVRGNRDLLRVTLYSMGRPVMDVTDVEPGTLQTD